jgi:hypothetical protein
MKPQTTVTDDKLASCEVFNHHEKHTVHVKRLRKMDMYLLGCNKWIGPHTVELKPGTRYLLPHQYYEFFFKDTNEPAPLLVSFGDHIGKGHLRPSLPLVEMKK